MSSTTLDPAQILAWLSHLIGALRAAEQRRRWTQAEPATSVAEGSRRVAGR
jgi:hypothetical protein